MLLYPHKFTLGWLKTKIEWVTPIEIKSVKMTNLRTNSYKNSKIIHGLETQK